MNLGTVFNWKFRNRVYIAGKVTGLPETEVRTNFDIRKSDLQKAGYEVFCPIEVCKRNWGWFRCMVVCVFNLVCKCNKISLLDNWENSKGAKIEYKIAKILKYKIV